MTKQVRIENADNSAYKVWVYEETLNHTTGQWERSEPKKLDYPTHMYVGFVHGEKRLVVVEPTDNELT